MRACLQSPSARLPVGLLALWVLVSAVDLGSHVAVAEAPGLRAGDGEHQPWHRHVIDDGVAARLPGFEHCAVCLLKGDPETLTADLAGVPRIDDSSAALQLDSGKAVRLKAPPGLAPRAPPTG